MITAAALAGIVASVPPDVRRDAFAYVRVVVDVGSIPIDASCVVPVKRPEPSEALLTLACIARHMRDRWGDRIPWRGWYALSALTRLVSGAVLVARHTADVLSTDDGRKFVLPALRANDDGRAS